MNKLIFLSLVFCSFVARGSADTPMTDAAQPKKPTEAEGKTAHSQQPLTLKDLMKMRCKSFADSDSVDSVEEEMMQLLMEKASVDFLNAKDVSPYDPNIKQKFIKAMLKQCYGSKAVDDLINELYAMRQAKRQEIYQHGGYSCRGTGI